MIAQVLMLCESICAQEIASQEKSLGGSDGVWLEGGFGVLQTCKGQRRCENGRRGAEGRGPRR